MHLLCEVMDKMTSLDEVWGRAFMTATLSAVLTLALGRWLKSYLPVGIVLGLIGGFFQSFATPLDRSDPVNEAAWHEDSRYSANAVQSPLLPLAVPIAVGALGDSKRNR